MLNATFNGADLLVVAIVLVAAALAAYAAKRHRECKTHSRDECPPPDLYGTELASDLTTVRAVRASFGDLPYRNARRRPGAKW